MSGVLTTQQMVEHILTRGVRGMWLRDLQRMLSSIAARGPGVVGFVEAEVPQTWPMVGSIFVTDSLGRRWRLARYGSKWHVQRAGASIGQVAP